ncbi:MAG: hydroxymethylpyrimidine/phosphomethylpyrimidine kinase [Herminiimonas sp.]|jgi:hydroxymethylpyrimidine/phosphomethylpyrimidine kinase|nr:hydroxymethylpyrimidine/phosphomethylpyrimidine kinase [Herminiimonas sp.]
MIRPSVLVFAGSDPSGGAGIQADIQAIAALGAHPLSVITALTVQDNDRVFAVHPVPPSLVRQQAAALTDKVSIAAVKIGIVADLANAETIVTIVRELRTRQPQLPVVFDPVLASGHGDALAVGNAVRNIAPLMAIATLITPNLIEAAALCADAEGDNPAGQAASLMARGCAHVLIKGGHGAPDAAVLNQWFSANDSRTWTWPRLPGAFHGSGCTLASAIAACLAQDMPIAESLEQAQRYCHRALAASYVIAPGQRIPNRYAVIREQT